MPVPVSVSQDPKQVRKNPLLHDRHRNSYKAYKPETTEMILGEDEWFSPVKGLL